MGWWPEWWPKWLYTLSDPADRWIARDKLDHAGLSAALFLAIAWLVGDPLAGWFAVAVAGILVESVEVLRWQTWQRRAWPVEWPWLTDKISLKDLVADAAGAATGHGILIVLHFTFGW